MPIIRVNYLPVRYSISPGVVYYARGKFNEYKIVSHPARKALFRCRLSQAIFPKIEATTGQEYLDQIICKNPADIRIAEEILKQWRCENEMPPNKWHVDSSGNYNLDDIFFWGTIFSDSDGELYVGSFKHEVHISFFCASLSLELNKIKELTSYELENIISPCFPSIA